MSWNLLIVEDDADISDTLCLIFSSRGFRCWRATNGREALATVNRNGFRPDAILLDLMMPVMDGLEFLELREREPLLAKAPVIVISAQPDLLTKLDADVSAKIYATLAKPTDLLLLLDTVDRACHGQPAPRKK